jgi:endonuclease/exonuclease/phosphatase family metal-dependent hydrolase
MRVLTWNLWWRFGDWPGRQLAIEATLEREAPDVCFLQEVWMSGDDSLAARLAERLGHHYEVAPAAPLTRWHGKVDDPAPGAGVAILSRWPLTHAEHEPLPGHGTEAWPVLHAVIDAPSGPVPVFCTHLHSHPAGSAARTVQVSHLARYVADRAIDGGHPPVLAGDFNALPESDEIRLLEGVLTAPSVDGQVLLDSWRYADPSAAGHTWDRRNPHVAATGEPGGRIDYVFVGPPAGGRGAVRSVRLAGAHPERGTWPSDHFAVLVELASEAGVPPAAAVGKDARRVSSPPH